MRLFKLVESKRRFFVYSFPETADESGNFDLTLLTDTDFYATSVSSASTEAFFIYNLSTEKQIIPTLLPVINPIIQGNGGTPYFFPEPWKLQGGTILRLVTSAVSSQISIAGYRQ